MKPWLQARTPAQILWLTAAVNALVVIGLGVMAVARHHHSLILFAAGLATIGILAGLLIERKVKNGIAAGRWPDSTMERMRDFFAHPAFPLLYWALFAAAIMASYLSSPLNPAWLMMVVWPSISLGRINTLLRQKTQPASSRLLTLDEPPKPLHSDHWGNPPSTFAR